MLKVLSFPPTIGKLDGVTSFMYYNYRSKLHVEASSTQSGHPFNVVDPTKTCGTINCIWHSHYLTPKGNITIMLGIPLYITHYTLNSRPDNHGFPTDWVLEGSNNNETWDKLDTVNDEQNLTANDVKKVFKCDKSGLYHMFRFTMTDLNTDSNQGFVLYKIELFGNLMIYRLMLTLARKTNNFLSFLFVSIILLT